MRVLSTEEIKKMRESMGLTQVEFARKVGVSPTTVYRWEKGGRIQKMESKRKLVELERKHKGTKTE